MSAVLTQKQLAVYEFISAYSNLHGEAPTFQEIGGGLNLASSNTVSHHIKQLKKKGYLRENSSGKRRYEILNPAPCQCAALPDLIEAAEKLLASDTETVWDAAAYKSAKDALRSALAQAKGGVK